jgi:hypothetical protein
VGNSPDPRRSGRRSRGPLRQPAGSARTDLVRLPAHVNLPVILVRHPEAESLVELPARIDLHDRETDGRR